MKTGNEKIVYIDGKGFNILEVDDQLLRELFGQLIRECGNYRWCPTEEEIEEICREVYKRRLYELDTIYSHRKNLMNEWVDWSFQVDLWNNKVHYGKSVYQPYVGGVHMITPDPTNGWSEIVIDPNSSAYPNSDFYTYTHEDINRLYDFVQNNTENVWERQIHREPRHPDYNCTILENGEQIHHYRLFIENFAFACSNIVDVYINIGTTIMDYLRVDRFYRELKNHIEEYAQTCDYAKFMTLSKVIWSNSTLEFNNVHDDIVLIINDLHMGG